MQVPHNRKCLLSQIKSTRQPLQGSRVDASKSLTRDYENCSVHVLDIKEKGWGCPHEIFVFEKYLISSKRASLSNMSNLVRTWLNSVYTSGISQPFGLRTLAKCEFFTSPRWPSRTSYPQNCSTMQIFWIAELTFTQFVRVGCSKLW